MTIADQAKAIRDPLSKWASDQGGKAFIAADLHHLWNMANVSSKNPRVIIVFNGEDPRGDSTMSAILRRVDRNWIALVTRGNISLAQRGDSLTQDDSATAFLTLIGQARDIIRSIVGASVELPVDYKGIRPYQIGDVLMDAYQIDFSMADDLSEIVEAPDNPVAIPA